MKGDDFMRKLLCILLVLSMISGYMIFNTSVVSITKENGIEKISKQLEVTLNTMDKDEKVEVAIWLNDESEEVYNNAYDENIKKAISKKEIAVNVDQAQAIMNNDMMPLFTDVTIEDVQSVLSVKRLTGSNIISLNNMSWIENFSIANKNEFDIIFVSQYAPLVILELSKEDILTLQEDNDVCRVLLWNNEVEVTFDSNVDISLAAETVDYGVWQNITNIYTMRYVNGYTGRNINIGLLEGALPDPQETLVRDNIISCGGTSNYIIYVAHATYMAEIIAGENDNFTGVAPNANLYCIGVMDDVLSTLDTLMTYPVNIINMSVTFESFDESLTNLYDVYSQYLDYLIYRYNVTVCTAAGNNTVNGVMDGQMSYNSIVVGNIDDKDTITLSDDERHSSSSYATGANVAYKPDLCAPGHNVRTPLIGETSAGGTSAASAVVTGACALLMEANPILISKPLLMKSILMSSVNRIATLSNVFSTSTSTAPALLRAYGAGMIDVINANNLVRNNNWKYISYNEQMDGSANYTMDISVSQNAVNRNKKLSVCLIWDAFARENTSSMFPGFMNSIVHRLELYDPSGICVARSRISYDKKQYIYYKPTVAGTYEARIVKVNDDGSSVAVAAMSYSLL